MSLHFIAVVLTGERPVTIQVYGPAVHVLPAIGWASVQLIAHGLCLIGSLKRWPLFLVAGGVPAMCLHASFASMAALAEQGTLLQAGALWLSLPISICTVFAGIGGLKLG